MDKKDKQKEYGSVGWREFSDVRSELLNVLESSKKRTSGRKVKTAHGNAAEAQFRKVLSQYLPKKYAVTSGYIIPSLVAQQYDLEHYDIIIYDALNAPVLWVEGNADDSVQGKKRAIPSEYILAVYEVKSSLTTANAKKTVEKLKSLNQFSEHLSMPFHSGCIFFELPESKTKKNTILKQLINLSGVHKYRNGVVLTCSDNEQISASIRIFKDTSENLEKLNKDHPISRDTDTVKVTRTETTFTVSPDTPSGSNGCPGITLIGLNNEWQPSKTYTATYGENEYRIHIQWSKNQFSSFFLDMLALLEGKDPNETPYTFAQIFDTI